MTDVTTELDTTVVVDGDGDDEVDTTAAGSGVDSLGFAELAIPAMAITPTAAPAIQGHFFLRVGVGTVIDSPPGSDHSVRR